MTTSEEEYKEMDLYDIYDDERLNAMYQADEEYQKYLARQSAIAKNINKINRKRKSLEKKGIESVKILFQFAIFFEYYDIMQQRTLVSSVE